MSYARIVLFSLMIAQGSPSFARITIIECLNPGAVPKQATALGKIGCEAECDSYYETAPSARPGYGEARACQASGGKYAYEALSPVACMKGAWHGVLSLPQIYKAYGMLVENAGAYIQQHMQEHQAFVASCNQDSSCRREVARGMEQYRAKNAQGEWIVADAEVDKEAQSTDIVSLLMKVEQHQTGFRNYCNHELYGINQRLTSQNLEPFDFATQRYQQLVAKDSQCVGALKLKPPRAEDFKERETGKWLKDLGIKLQCYPPAKMTELICLEVAANVLDPSNLIGGGLALKAMSKAGLAARSATRVLGRRMEEKAALSLATPKAVPFDFTASGVTRPAHTYSFKVGEGAVQKEIEVIVPAKSSGAADKGRAEKIRSVLGAMPEGALKDLDRVVVNPKRNISDEYWRREYKGFFTKAFGFKSAATGGFSGSKFVVDFYPSGMSRWLMNSERSELMAHELGHVVAARRLGSTTPPASYFAAKLRDGNKVTSYGENSLAEDFAEAMAAYIKTEGGIHNPAILEKFKGRFDYIDDVLQLNAVEKQAVFKDYQARISTIHGVAVRRVAGTTVMTSAGHSVVVDDESEE